MLGAIVAQMKARIRSAISVVVRKTIVITLAVVVVICAAAFGLIAAYHALISIYGFTPLESVGIVAGSLVGLGALVLTVLPLIGPKPSKPSEPKIVTAPRDALVALDQGLGKATKQFGALPVIAIAFAAGLLASRR